MIQQSQSGQGSISAAAAVAENVFLRSAAVQYLVEFNCHTGNETDLLRVREDFR